MAISWRALFCPCVVYFDQLLGAALPKALQIAQNKLLRLLDNPTIKDKKALRKCLINLT